ncbi:MAG: CatB-related O-acetyltransferase [Desulfobacteraceae bacterium]|jgi:acetyltransferase-like isoleucine patch superfamily enzyme|nr:CatB-related O-acetyltransferase [Desulfobacteraceae bacterium]
MSIKPFRRLFPKKKKTLQERYPQYEIGKWTYGSPKIHSWGEGATFRIGAFCSIADGVKIYLGGEHRTDWVTTFPFSILWESGDTLEGHPKTKGDVIIGNDVWLGADSVILSGVTIGDGAAIGARAVVTGNVPPYAIVAGNPARIVKNRFDDETISRLLKIKWWEWKDAKIDMALPMLLNDDIRKFIEFAESAT